jgi:glycosyltransferase involved in cell wall biosynthesis
MSERPSIVVLTPLKNDAWILRRFLAVTSLFADRIIIADQGSTDGGLEICREFPTVTVIDNSASAYDEASRQRLLIAAGRAAVPMPRILMGIDSDEIFSADSVNSADWLRMLTAPPGTVVFCEKPTLFLSPSTVERRPVDFRVAFVDDDVSPHSASRVHSPRVPMPEGAPQLVLAELKLLHYALTRPEAQKAKFRMYAALENLMATKTAYWRRRYYWHGRVWRPNGPLEPTPPEWYAGWEARGIDMTTIEDVQPYWQDVALLDLMYEHGARRFWLDDVWEKDWERFRRELGRPQRVDQPPWLVRKSIDAAQLALETAASLRQALRRL